MIKLITYFETLLTYLSNFIMYIIMFFLNPGHKFKEVKEKKLYPPKNKEAKKFDSLDKKAYVREFAELAYNFGFKRQEKLENKNKVLITITLILIALMVIINDFSNIWFKTSIIFGILALYSILYNLGVVVVHLPDYFDIIDEVNDSDNSVDTFEDNNVDKIRKRVIKEYYKATGGNCQTNNFFVGIYTTSKRLIVLQILFILIGII
jgi:hypothetical protein